MERALLPFLQAVLLAAVVLAPASSEAAPLPFAGSLELDLRGLRARVTGSGVATGNASGGELLSFALPPGALATSGLSIAIDDPLAFPVRGLVLTARNAAGQFAATGGGPWGGAMPILGVARVCLFAPCSFPPPANLSVPLSPVGQGGTATATGPLDVTVAGGPWSSGRVQLALPIVSFTSARTGFAHGPASATSSTAAASGALRLVAPIVVSTDIPADQPSLFGFATLTLHFVPEPASVALLGSGLLLLALGGVRRR